MGQKWKRNPVNTSLFPMLQISINYNTMWRAKTLQKMIKKSTGEIRYLAKKTTLIKTKRRTPAVQERKKSLYILQGDRKE